MIRHRIYSTDNYLLNQTLRRYYQGEDKILISKKADNLWQQMFNEDKDIRKFSYNDKIIVDKTLQIKYINFQEAKNRL